MKFRLIILCIVLSNTTARSQESVKILFIGNSLTYYNNLPVLVEKAAKAKGVKVETQMVAKPNYALIDHLDDGKVQELIKAGEFAYVIIQQGPSSQAEGRKMLHDDGLKLARLCMEGKAKLCFFMVWPSLNYYSTFDGVIESHELAAKACGAVLLPVGKTWKSHIEASGEYSYYGPDGFHPSLAGSKVAAEIIVAELFQ